MQFIWDNWKVSGYCEMPGELADASFSAAPMEVTVTPSSHAQHAQPVPPLAKSKYYLCQQWCGDKCLFFLAIKLKSQQRWDEGALWWLAEVLNADVHFPITNTVRGPNAISWPINTYFTRWLICTTSLVWFCMTSVRGRFRGSHSYILQICHLVKYVRFFTKLLVRISHQVKYVWIGLEVQLPLTHSTQYSP